MAFLFSAERETDDNKTILSSLSKSVYGFGIICVCACVYMCISSKSVSFVHCHCFCVFKPVCAKT